MVPSGRLLADWRYTAARTADAHRLVERFAAFRRGEAAPPDEEEAERPLHGREPQKRANTLALIRLLRFARARKGLIALGFVLTLATTGVSLIPPWLTMPLVNNYFVPFQSGRDAIDTSYAARLDGLAAASAAADDFEDAIALQDKAVAVAPEAEKNSFRAHLETYKARGGPNAERPKPSEEAQAKAAAADRQAAEAHAQALVEFQESQREHFMTIGWYLAAFAGAAVLAWLLGWAQGVAMAYVSERISADLRNEAYAHLNRLSLDFFGGRRTGDLIARLSTDTERLCSYLSDNLVDFATDVLMIVGTTIVLLTMDPTLAVAAVCPFPIIAWIVYRARTQMQHGFRRGGRAWSAMTSVLADTIPGMRVVKAFAQEKREIERFRRSNEAVVEANDRVNTVWTFFWPMVAMLTQFGLLVVWAAGAYQMYHLRVDYGMLAAFFIFIGRFYARMESMSRMVSATERAANSAQRLFEILDRVPSVAEPLSPIHPENVRGDVELRGVGFRYGTRSIIENFNLKIESGEMIGLVGASGSGKTTLVNLVCRFYDVSEGAILVDGIDIRNFSVAEYRRQIGLVLQEPFLFFGTVAENIAYGRPEATPDEIIAAARGRPGTRFHPAPAAGLQLAGRRAGTVFVGRRAAADFDRPRAADQSADLDSGRGDLQRRHHDRARNPIGARQPGSRPNDDRHRPSIDDARTSRPAGGAGAGRDRGGGQARRAAGLGGRLCPALQRATRPPLKARPKTAETRGQSHFARVAVQNWDSPRRFSDRH